MDFRQYAAMKGFEAAAFCRLCAEPKPYNLLVDLKVDENKRIMILKKISRLKLLVDNLESDNDRLPKTVCNLCIDSLDKFFNFVLEVDTAQQVLKEQVLGDVMDTDVSDIDLHCAIVDGSSDVELIEDNISPSAISDLLIADESTNVNKSQIDQDLFSKIIPMQSVSTYVDDLPNDLVIIDDNKLPLKSNVERIANDKSINDTMIVQKTEVNHGIDDNLSQIPLQVSPSVNGSQKEIEDGINENAPDKSLLKNDFEILVSDVAIEIKPERMLDKNKSESVVAGSSNVNKLERSLDKNDSDIKKGVNSKAQLLKRKRKRNESLKKLKNRKGIVFKPCDNDEDCADNLPISQLNLTWKDYSWKCDFCTVLFPTIDTLIEHSMQLHHSCNPYQCIDCRVRCSNLDSFIKHVVGHRPYLKFSCFKCHMTFLKASNVRLHYGSHLKTKFICYGCDESNFQNPEELAKHIEKYKRELNNPLLMELWKKTDGLSCTQCKTEFSSRFALKQHLLEFHLGVKTEFNCPTCGKMFICKGKLSNHIKTHDPKIHECKICSRKFRSTELLYLHVGVHDSSKPLSCDQCGKLFRCKDHLKKHSRVHSEVKPWECNVCHKIFRAKASLTSHTRLHTGVKPYSCPICKTGFRTWTTYNLHMKTLHGVDKAKTKLTPNGRFPVDLITGEVIENIEPELLDWKKQILSMKEKQ